MKVDNEILRGSSWDGLIHLDGASLSIVAHLYSPGPAGGFGDVGNAEGLGKIAACFWK